ncbi:MULTISPECIES: ABC transporter permease [Spirosoma]|uniref:Permease prefix domain 2-containing transporter n=1 Tax=Spirosoma liriopis TaxID=2937440 RepID=A0ABT0HX42_9BACT|nr:MULTISPECIES: ABC transporter permease [Spirosoma]MCK8496100.1 permease prefix domain 2-containing transporter [Spirosoma liriopis]UHG94624.1 permease prefix domain 2-containing transporter [Spirosoma oryzicola]
MAQPPHNPLPPAWADRLLRLICPAELQEELLGDLHEQFKEHVAQLGESTAQRRYIWEVIRFCRPYFISRQLQLADLNPYSSLFFLRPSMLSSYLKIAWRNLWKHKLFSFINVFGLASGLTVCLLAMASIKGAFDLDSFHAHADRTYRILTDVVRLNNDVSPFATSPMPLAAALKKQYDFVDQVTRVVPTRNEFLGNHKRLTMKAYAVDTAFFQIFNYPLAKGLPPTQPNTVVLTPQTAGKFFGSGNPIGQTLYNPGLGTFTVTGVLAKPPTKSHLVFDMLMSWRVSDQSRAAYADWQPYTIGYTYVMLKPGTPLQSLEKVLPTVHSRATRDLQFKDIKGYSFRTQRLDHLSPSREELSLGTHEPSLAGLLVEFGVGLVTLLMAAFNYINLTLARSLSRAREVGIRKVAGALRSQLIGQFMAESVVLSLLALGLAFGLLEFIKPMAFVRQWLISGVQWDWTIWTAFILFSILAGLLAGIVPARILSGFEPARVLRSQTGLRTIRGISLRKSLIVLQFTISLIAMIGLLTMVRQMNYMATGDYGFRRDRILILPLSDVPVERLMNELDRVAGVERVGATSELLGSHGGMRQWVKRRRASQDSSVAFISSVNHQFVSTLNLTLLAGQNLPQATADTSGRLVVINEEAVKALRLGSPQEAVGQSVWLNDTTDVSIAGVVKDFHFTSFSLAVEPLVLRSIPSQYRYVNIGVAAGAEAAVLTDVQRIWKQLSPYQPFEGQWYEDFLRERHSHHEDTNFMWLLIGLAFSIACLGLLGMVTYNTQTRVKEVGIRKVLGAEVGQLVWLLSGDFVRLLLIAGVMALPLGYLAGYAFLVHFAYRVSIGVETLGLCLVVLLVLGSLTIGLRTYRAALMNPTDSLRSE